MGTAHHPTAVTPWRAETVAEGGGFSVFIPGVPVAADGATLEEATAEMVDALREYAEDWRDRLRDALGHHGNRALVRLIESNDDDRLRALLL
ncbi:MULTISPECIES: hypothetical protein [unclassified Nocardiopsis]|uniref:hypothetical protein n=1 Tax=Nocardiopsis TaxID=2013 RepID=UPI00387B929A